ncbi:MAG: DUF6076 domain-containing protein [Clostridia bacterium]
MINLNLRFDTNDNELLDFNNFYESDNIVFIDDSFSIKSVGTLLLDFLNTNFENFDNFLIFFMKYGPFGYKNFFKNSFKKFIDSILVEDMTYIEFKQIIHKFYLKHNSDFIKFQSKLINIISYTYNVDNNKTISNLKPLERNYLAAKKYSFDYSIDVSMRTQYDTILHSNNQYKKLLDTFQSEKNLIKDIKNKELKIIPSISYQSNDMFSLVIISFNQVLQNNKKVIKRCNNCGKFFIPISKSNEIFCDNLYGTTNKTCKQVGAAIAYNNKLKKDDVQRKYRSTYSNWCMLVKRYPDIESYKLNFEIWKKEAKKFKDDIKKGLSTNDDFLDWLEIHKGGYSYGR